MIENVHDCVLIGQENVNLEEIADPQDDTCADCAYLEGYSPQKIDTVKLV